MKPALSVITAVTLAIAQPSPAQPSFGIVVAPQRDVPLAENDALGVIQTLVNRLNQSCGPLRVGFEFSPLPTSFAGAADGGSFTALRRFRDTGTSMQIVPSISRCPDPPLGADIFGGCTPRTGPILLRHYPVSGQEGRAKAAQIWAHEMGHAQGLIRDFPGYVNSHNPAGSALMNTHASATRWGMNPTECATYYANQLFPPPQPAPILAADEEAEDRQDAPPEARDGVVEILPEELPPDDDQPEGDQLVVDDFLHGDWFNGLPVDIIEENRERLLPAAEDAIDANRVDLWPGSAVVVAYAGQSGAAQRLDRVIRADPDELGAELSEIQSFRLNDARIRAAGALGYVVYRAATGDYAGEDAGLAQELLDRFVTPGNAAELAFAADGRDAAQLGRDVTLNALSGLALVASFDDDALGRIEGIGRANSQGTLDLGVDDAYFAALLEQVEISRQIRGGGSVALIDLLMR